MSNGPPPRVSALAWPILALVLWLVWDHAAPLRAKLADARASRDIVVDDDAFYRVDAVLGSEMPLLESVRAQLPPGTPIAVSGEGSAELVARRQRFWLALLPTYPVTADAETEICPRPCVARAAEVLAEGDGFVWIRRAGAP